MLPTPTTEFRPISEIAYHEEKGYFCCAIVFSPDTENNHFAGCPPYIQLGHAEMDDLFFRVPDTVAYYGTIHAGYTMKGRERAVERGRKEMKQELRSLIMEEDA